VRSKVVAVVVTFLFLATAAHAQTLNTIWSFTNGSDGSEPYGGLAWDKSGNLYGVNWGGSYGAGLVYELSPGAGGWTENTLHTFTGGTDQAFPMGRLIADSSGNFYGTTYGTGALGGSGVGTVFELSPNGEGGYNFNTLYTFQGGNDGSGPAAGLIIDAAGNLYGTTEFGGGATVCQNQGTVFGCGTVFELSPTKNGWVETILYAFQGKDGQAPTAGLARDAAGNLYGTTQYGGARFTGYFTGNGAIFELKYNAKKKTWKEHVLHSFVSKKDGAGTYTGLTFDSNGNLYGATRNGGVDGTGVLFELEKNNAAWKYLILYTFTEGNDGGEPHDDFLYIDANGNVYGTTQKGGQDGGGVIFEFSKVNGAWQENVLWNFDFGNDGGDPASGVIPDSNGNLYGTAFFGGADFAGAVYELTP